MPRQPLGRGLSTLLGDEPPKDSSIFELGIDQIEPNADQPRTRFDESSLDELAMSIDSNGIIQPIVVRKKNGGYQIVAGERRWRAAQKAGLRNVPVVVREIGDEKLLEIALIENIQRQELNAVEEARAFRKLIDNIGLTQEMVSARIGKSRSMIATSLRLLKLPAEVLDLIENEKITPGHARALLTTDDAGIQQRVAKTIVSLSLSVREAERMVKRESKSPEVIDKTRLKGVRDANLISAETKLRRRLGTSVKIQPSKTGMGGKIEIEYYSVDDLDRLYQALMEVIN